MTGAARTYEHGVRRLILSVACASAVLTWFGCTSKSGPQVVSTPTAVVTAACSEERDLLVGDTRATFNSRGTERQYLLHVPSSFSSEAEHPVPGGAGALHMAFHG